MLTAALMNPLPDRGKVPCCRVNAFLDEVLAALEKRVRQEVPEAVWDGLVADIDFARIAHLGRDAAQD